jgi:hypothetical protein
MLNEIITIIAIACAVAILISNENYFIFLDRLKLNFKPFSCALCLSFWLSLSYTITTQLPIMHIITLPFIGAIVGELIFRKLNYL